MLRAPEVILGATWDWRVDIWNLGALVSTRYSQCISFPACIVLTRTKLWELVEGKVLFDGTATPKAPYTTEAHLAQMIAVLGKMPDDLLLRGAQHASKYFDPEFNLLVSSPFPPCSLEGFSDYQDLDKKQYLDFLRSMLQLSPEGRPSASSLLQAPWLCG